MCLILSGTSIRSIKNIQVINIGITTYKKWEVMTN